MFARPRWEWPPFRKIDLARFKRQVEESVPQTRVLRPEIFHTYDLMQLKKRLHYTPLITFNSLFRLVSVGMPGPSMSQ